MLEWVTEVLGDEGECDRCGHKILGEGLPVACRIRVEKVDLSASLRGAVAGTAMFGMQPGALAISQAMGVMPDPPDPEIVKEAKLCFRCAAHVMGAIDEEPSKEEAECKTVMEKDRKRA